MTMNEVVVCTPRYVLLDGDRRLGPKVIPLPAAYELVLDQQAKAYRLEAVTEAVKKTK